ncbi:MAG TPA: hypothetical protein VN577_06345 [Terriglobales bacterium]|nr:hypothetical protein [Terriglobales bacterium]
MGNRNGESGGKGRRWLVVVLAVAVVALIAAAFAMALLNRSDKSKSLDGFAKCLTEKKAVMYGSSICPHCLDQKELFGESFQYVTYVECRVPGQKEPAPACSWAGVKQVPTWIFADGQRRLGTTPLAELSSKTGCPLP